MPTAALLGAFVGSTRTVASNETRPKGDRGSRVLVDVRLVVLALVVASAVAFWDLGGAPFEDWDEGHHAKVALDMWRGGEWLVYALDGEREEANLKPPLMFYALIGAFTLAGPTELAARVVPAASFVALTVVTVWFVARVLSVPAALGTLVLLVTSRPFLFEHFARDAVVDAVLALFLALTMYGLWLGARPALVATAFAVALLAKGVAALQILPPALLWTWYRRDAARARTLLVAAAVATLPLAVWLWMREHAAPGFVAAMLSFDVAARLSTVVGAPHAHPWLYVERLVGDFDRIACALVLLLVLARGRVDLGAVARTPRDASSFLVFLLLWWLIPILEFSLFRTKHEWYVLPSYVPAYVLAAWVAAAALPKAVARLAPARRSFATVTIGVALAAFVGGRTLSRLAYKIPRESASRRAELDMLLASVGTGSGCAVRLHRPWSMPAVRFYLTRAGVPYAPLDPRALASGTCVLATGGDRDALLAELPTLRTVDEHRGLRLAVVRAPES